MSTGNFSADIPIYISRKSRYVETQISHTHSLPAGAAFPLSFTHVRGSAQCGQGILELCDALRDKYEMPEGDWKALLDKGMALHARIPEGALSFEAVQVVGHESALNAVDVLRRDLDPILSRVEEGLRNGVAKEEDAGSKKPEREMGADEGAAWAAELMRNLVQYRIDLMLKDIGEHGNVRLPRSTWPRRR